MVYENDFRKKKEELVIWSSQFLNRDQKSQLETLLSEKKKKFKVTFKDTDWTPCPIFDRI